MIEKILSAVFGEDFASELVTFMSTFSGIFQSLNVDVNTMRRFLSGPDVAFLLVSSPAPETLTEALFFQDKTRDLGLPFRGFVLNRSRARNVDKPLPDALDAKAESAAAQSALKTLKTLASRELDAARKDFGLLTDLKNRAGLNATAMAVPELPQGADDMSTLLTVADYLSQS